VLDYVQQHNGIEQRLPTDVVFRESPLFDLDPRERQNRTALLLTSIPRTSK
jgi:hypothetical protein